MVVIFTLNEQQPCGSIVTMGFLSSGQSLHSLGQQPKMLEGGSRSILDVHISN